MSVCLSVRSLISKTTRPNLTNFFVPVTVTQSCSDNNAIRYVLPVLWMTSCLLIIGQAKATPIGRMLKVTQRTGSTGAKSDVYD